MNEHTSNQLTRFMSILKTLKLSKEEILGICSLLETEEMMVEMVRRLRAKDFQLTPQETMNICGGRNQGTSSGKENIRKSLKNTVRTIRGRFYD